MPKDTIFLTMDVKTKNRYQNKDNGFLVLSKYCLMHHKFDGQYINNTYIFIVLLSWCHFWY